MILDSERVIYAGELYQVVERTKEKMKFIIEVEPIPGTELYKAKGFNALVFDEYGLEHLEKYDNAYIDRCIKTAMITERNRIQNEIKKVFGEAEQCLMR